jgi:predicted Fe-Mo cluster-binding NifX family protein
VAHHFGRCPHYAFVEVEDGEIQGAEVRPNPFFERHTPGAVPDFIREQGVDVMLTGGMGRRAIALFQQYGIETCTGAAGTVEESVRRYLAGELAGAAPCADHVHGEHHHGGDACC